jgi:hypothetical protein
MQLQELYRLYSVIPRIKPQRMANQSHHIKTGDGTKLSPTGAKNWKVPFSGSPERKASP